MNTQSLWLAGCLSAMVLVALLASLYVGRKLPTVADLLQRDLDAYLAQEIALEAAIVDRRHDLAACRDHQKRILKRLNAKPKEDGESKTIHIVRSRQQQ